MTAQGWRRGHDLEPTDPLFFQCSLSMTRPLHFTAQPCHWHIVDIWHLPHATSFPLPAWFLFSVSKCLIYFLTTHPLCCLECYGMPIVNFIVWSLCLSISLFHWWSTLITERRCHRSSFLSKGYIWWFSVTFWAVVLVGIWNLAMVPAIACLLFMKKWTSSLIICLICHWES